jgi:hypothetical protein
LFQTIGGVGGAALKSTQLVIKLRAGAAGLIEHRAIQKNRIIPDQLALLWPAADSCEVGTKYAISMRYFAKGI